MLLSKKDIIAINQELGESGLFKNEGSLDFALSALKGKKSWLYELAYIVRAILIDHVFEDGNKRTTFVLIHNYLDDNMFSADKEKIKNIIILITKKNINDINRIMRLTKRCYHQK